MKLFWMRIWSICFVLIVLSIGWSVAYFLMQALYRYFESWPNLWLQQLLTSLVGIILLTVAGFIAGRLNKKKFEQRKAFLNSITDAIQQIATGDFNINLAKIKAHDNPFDPIGKIVDHINDMAKDLGEVEQMRQEFISNVSHEIQSPLTSIGGFAHALKNKNLTEEERVRYLTIIENESQRLSNISDNLLKLTYLESEKYDFTLKKYRLDKQLQEIVLACEPQWQKKNLNIRLEMGEVLIEANEELMNQVWFNLLNNAIKFTEADGQITLQAQSVEDRLIVSIKDTGIGISNEEKLHLFERFYKADKARSRHQSGSGLGLAIVKKILVLHGAEIKVDSSAAGTTFTIRFNPAMKGS